MKSHIQLRLDSPRRPVITADKRTRERMAEVAANLDDLAALASHYAPELSAKFADAAKTLRKFLAADAFEIETKPM